MSIRSKNHYRQNDVIIGGPPELDLRTRPTGWDSLGSQPVVLAPPRSQNSCPDLKTVVRLRGCSAWLGPGNGSAPLRARFALVGAPFRSAVSRPQPGSATTPAGQPISDLANRFQICSIGSRSSQPDLELDLRNRPTAG